MGVTSRAVVEVVADASKVAATVQRALNEAFASIDTSRAKVAFDKIADNAKASLGGIGDEAADAGDRVGTAFDKGADEAKDSLNDIGRALSGVAEDADRVGREVGDDFQAGGETAERALRELDRTATTEFASIAAKADAAATATGARLGGMFGLLSTGLVTAGAAVGVGLAAITGFGLSTAASLEQTRIAFQSLLGGVEQGNTVFASLQKFAAVTPFEFADLTGIAQKFLAFSGGVGLARDQLEPFLTVVGNVISVTGGGAQALDSVARAFGHISSGGKVSLEDINILSDALPGFSGVAAIAAARGITTAEAMKAISAGTIDATTGTAALIAGMQQFPGAAGAMDLQAQTLLGVFSTFKDVVGQALAGAFEPVIPLVKQSLADVTPILGEAASQLAPALGSVLAAALPALAALVQGLVPVLVPILEAIGGALGSLAPALQPLGVALGSIITAAAPILAPISAIIAAVATGLVPVFASLEPVISGIAAVVVSVFAPLAPVIALVGQTIGAVLLPVATLLGDLFTQLAPVLGVIVAALGAALAPIMAALGPVIATVVDALQPLIPAIVALLPPVVQILVALSPLIEVLAMMIGLVATLLSPILKLAATFLALLATEAIVPLVELLAKALVFVLQPLEKLTPLIAKFSEFIENINWGAVGSAIGGAFATAWHAVVDFFVGVGHWFAALPGQIGAFLASLPQRFIDGLAAAFNAGLRAIGVGIGLILAAIILLPQLIMDGLAALPGLLWDFFTSVFFTVLELATAGFQLVVGLAVALPGQLLAALVALPGLIGGAFTAALDFAKSAAVDGFNGILDFVRSVPGRIADLAGLMADAGLSLIRGLMSGLGQAGSFVGDLASRIVGAIKGFLNQVIGSINSGIAQVDDALPVSLPRIPSLATGGLTTREGLAALHPRELVLPLESSRAVDLLSRAISEANAGLRAVGVPAGGTPDFDVRVYIGQTELTDLVDVRISERNRGLKSRVQAGTGRR